MVTELTFQGWMELPQHEGGRGLSWQGSNICKSNGDVNEHRALGKQRWFLSLEHRLFSDGGGRSGSSLDLRLEGHVCKGPCIPFSEWADYVMFFPC